MQCYFRFFSNQSYYCSQTSPHYLDRESPAKGLRTAERKTSDKNTPHRNSPQDGAKSSEREEGEGPRECAPGTLVFFQRDTKLLVNKLEVRGLCRIRGLLLRDEGGGGREFPRNYKAKTLGDPSVTGAQRSAAGVATAGAAEPQYRARTASSDGSWRHTSHRGLATCAGSSEVLPALP